MNKIVSIAAIVLVLLSCEKVEEPTNEQNDKYGGILHLNVPENIYSLIPTEISNESEWFIAGQIFETIVQLRSGQPTPNKGLIKAISEADSDTTFFEFHPNVIFSNGNPLDSITMVPWVKQLNLNGLECYFSEEQKTLIVLNTSLDEASLKLSHRDSYLFTIDKDIPVGTGPFKLVSINEDISINLAKNTEYHDNQLPYVDGVELRMIKTKNTEIEEFMNGSLDLIRLNPLQRLQFSNVLSLENHPNFLLTEHDEKTYCFGLTYNMDSLDTYQIGKVLKDQPVVYEMSNSPRLLRFPNLSHSKFSSTIAVDSDNSTFSQLTLESLIENKVPLSANERRLIDQKALYLTMGRLDADGKPELNVPREIINSADYLVILNSWSGLTVNQYYLKVEDHSAGAMIDLKSVYFKEPIKLE